MAGILPFGAVFIELFFILTVSYEWFYLLRSTILFSFLKTSSSDATVQVMQQFFWWLKLMCQGIRDVV